MPGPSRYDNDAYWSTLHKDQRGQLTAVGYRALGEGYNRATYKIRLAVLMRLLRNVTGGDLPRNLLENAVGVGAYARLWAALGIRHWVGTDISSDAIELMRTQSPQATFVQVDLADEGYPTKITGHFDLVTAIDVLYHITDDARFEQALKNLASKVKPSGLLIVSDIFGPRRIQTAEHVVRRPLEQYAAVLSSCGLQAVDRMPVFGVLGDPLRLPDIASRALFASWRVVQKTIRITPAVLRNKVGFAIASSLRPLDALIRNSGLATSRNLEFVAFRKEPPRAPPT
jgi:2-polyprenyl-3-methyl-5-hydroxy-6-metoxy-1,4-benzoquinol methylase